MPDPSHNSANIKNRGLGNWFGFGKTDGSKSAKPAKFDPKIYYLGAWRLLKNDFLVFLAKLASDVVRGALWLTSLAFIGVSIFMAMRGFIDSSIVGFPGVAALANQLADFLSRPAFMVGASGLLLCTWALSLCLDSLALAGIWGIFDERLRERQNPNRTPARRRFASGLDFLRNANRHFSRVLALQITGLAAQAIVLVIGVMAIGGIFVATTGQGALADASIWTRALLWALPLTLLSTFAILVRLCVEAAAAPLILHGLTPGHAILEAATALVRHFVALYRLLLFGATLLLLPLSLYWVVLIVQQLMVDSPALVPIIALMRMAADLTLFISSGIIAVLFKGALFVFYHQLYRQPPAPNFVPMNDDTNSDTKRTSRIRGGDIPKLHSPHPARIEMTGNKTLKDFLPGSYPNIVSLDALISSARENPDEAEIAGLQTRRGIPGFGDFDGNLSEPASEPAEPPAPNEISGEDIFDTDTDINTDSD